MCMMAGILENIIYEENKKVTNRESIQSVINFTSSLKDDNNIGKT